MEYIDGYQADCLEQLPVEVLEDVALRIRRDSYLSEGHRDELLKNYLDERRWKLNKSFLYTEENLKRIEEMNDLLTRLALEAVQLAWNIYLENLELKKSGSDLFRPVYITPELIVPTDIYYREEGEKRVYTEREVQLWDIMTRLNPDRWTSILPGGTLCIGTESEDDECLEKQQQDVLWGGVPEEDPEKRSWGCVMNIDHEKTKHICFVWPFHTLLDFSCMALQDVLKINRFNMNIKLEYDEI